MIINCKNCNVNYLVPDKSLGSNGRNVKCVKCEAVWFQFPLSEENENLQSKLDELPKDLSFNHQHVPVIIERKLKILYISLAILLILIMIALGLYKYILNLSASIDIEIKDIKISRNAEEKQLDLNYQIYNSSDINQTFSVIIQAQNKNQKTLTTYNIENDQVIKSQEHKIFNDKLNDLPDETKVLIFNIKKIIN